MTEAATSCAGCGTLIRYEPIAFHGKSIGTPTHCDPCLDALDTQDAEQERETRLRNRIEKSQLPPELQGVALPEGGLGVVASRWAREELEKPGLCLVGPVGAGKTHLAASACWERLRRRNCLWLPVSHLLTQLRSGFGEAKTSASRAVGDLGAVILDDLDKVNATGYGQEVIFTAVDRRVQSGAPILVTTNLGLDAVRDKFGEGFGDAIASRLIGHCRVIRLEGEDRRTV